MGENERGGAGGRHERERRSRFEVEADGSALVPLREHSLTSSSQCLHLGDQSRSSLILSLDADVVADGSEHPVPVSPQDGISPIVVCQVMRQDTDDVPSFIGEPFDFFPGHTDKRSARWSERIELPSQNRVDSHDSPTTAARLDDGLRTGEPLSCIVHESLASTDTLVVLTPPQHSSQVSISCYFKKQAGSCHPSHLSVPVDVSTDAEVASIGTSVALPPPTGSFMLQPAVIRRRFGPYIPEACAGRHQRPSRCLKAGYH